jgi:hypothetical protein
MADKQVTEQQFFEQSISILFYLGQLPVIVFSCITMEIIGAKYVSPHSWINAGLIITALLTFVLSTAAVTKWRTSQRSAVILLGSSLIATLLYVTFLVRITEGSMSPYQHLYLYLPAVVFTVTQRRRWAEILTSIGVFISYLINYRHIQDWGAWGQFQKSNWFSLYEKLIIALLLFLLIIVNYMIEKLVQHKPPVITQEA